MRSVTASRRSGRSNTPDIFQNQSDFVCGRQHCDPDASIEQWDFNLYYKDVPNPVDGLFSETSTSGRPGSNCASIAAFKASALFTLSKTSGSKRGAYPPGFENSSTDSKRTLPSLDGLPGSWFLYRPTRADAGHDGNHEQLERRQLVFPGIG